MIEFQEIKKQYAKTQDENVVVLDNVNIQVDEGEAVGISGASGAGKTTLINIAAGLLRPDEGKVLINGTDIYGMSETKRDRFRAKNIGYIFQNFQLIPSLSAYENVMTALYFGHKIPTKDRKGRCEELLTKVWLQNRMTHLPGQLSGGEQQRVGIARALANHPPVLLADEPTANLDAKNRGRVIRLLQEANEEGITLLVATHDETLLRSLSRVIYL